MKRVAILCAIMLLSFTPAALLVGCQQEPAPGPPAPTTPPPPPASSGVVLYSDDFSGEMSGWETFDDENGWCIYKGGWLHLTNYTYAEYDTYSLIQKEFSDFILEVETKYVDGTTDNSHGVYCRADIYSESEIMPCYGFFISADGYYGIVKNVKDESVVLVPPTRSIHINKGRDVVNLMRIECIGSNLRLSVNGHLLTEVQDDSLSSGVLGLVATAWTEQDGKRFSEIAFDNIVVTAP